MNLGDRVRVVKVRKEDIGFFDHLVGREGKIVGVKSTWRLPFHVSIPRGTPLEYYGSVSNTYEVMFGEDELEVVE